MATPYEIEHNVKNEPQSRNRRPDMSTFFNQISQIATDGTDETHNNPNATPTPAELAAAHRLLREQFQFLREDGPSDDEDNARLLDRLIDESERHMESGPTKVEGVPQSYLDELDRVPKKELKKSDKCPICAEYFLDDPYPLVVRLPCHETHTFDLECVGPWLRLNGTCPLDRKDLLKKKEVPEPQPDEEDEEEDYDRMYG